MGEYCELHNARTQKLSHPSFIIFYLIVRKARLIRSKPSINIFNNSSGTKFSSVDVAQ